MTENIATYTFDFETEAEALRERLGPRADEIIFVDVSADPRNPDPAKRACARQVIGDKNLQEVAREEIDYVIGLYAKDIYFGSRRRPLVPRDDLTEEEEQDVIDGKRPDLVAGQMMYIQADIADINTLLGEKFGELFKLHTLLHEAGHTQLRDGPKMDDDHPQKENVADAYSALSLLQRFGPEAVPFLHMLSWFRAHEAIVSQKTNHLSSVLIDKIIYDSEHDDFSKLSQEDILARAAAYARDWTPAAKPLRESRDFFNRMQRIPEYRTDRIRSLLNTTASALKPGDLLLYILAKSALPLYHPEWRLGTAGTFGTSSLAGATEAERLKERMETISLSAFFNGAAPDHPDTGEASAADIINLRPAAPRKPAFKRGPG